MVEKEESANTPTFYDLRVKHGGNMGQLAQVSGVDGRSIHAMLLNRGVTRSDAELILAAFNRINQTSYVLDDIKVYMLDKYQEQQSPSIDTRPTFRQVCERCAVAWIELSRGAGVPDEVGLAFYNGEPVFVEDCDDMLAVLSALTGESWTRRDVRGIRFRNDTCNNPRLLGYRPIQ